jgi:hypothetical protein
MHAITPNGKGDSSPPFVYLVRADGAVDRACEFKQTIGSTLNPSPGTQYVAAAAGLHASYLVQSDGKIARTTGKGVVEPDLLSTDAPVVGGKEGLSVCAVM